MNSQIILRKIGGQFGACWRRDGILTLAGAAPSGGSMFGAFGRVLDAIALPLMLLAVLVVMCVTTRHHGATMTPFAGLAIGQLATTKRAAAAFRAQAKTIREELLDETKPLTQDELKTKTDAIASLEQRADAVAGFTPEADIEAQGGAPEGTRMEAPDGTSLGDDPKDAALENTRDLGKKYDRHVAIMRRAFGGPNGYLRAIARQQRGLEPFSAEQRKAHEAFQAFAQRSTIVGATGDASGGEFLLPLQQEHSIFRIPNVVSGMAAISRRFTVAGRTLRIPYVVQSSATVTRPMAGIANVGYIVENSSITEAEPTFAQRLLTVYGVKAYSEIGDETLQDDMTGQLSPALMDTVGQQVLNFIDEQATIDGNGTAQLTGALNAANTAIYSVTRNSASKVLYQDIFEMWTRCVKGPNTKWFVHPSVVPQLLALTLGSNALISFVTNFQGMPQMMLLGYPVEVTPLVSVLGSSSDVSICNGDFYALAIRNALSVESSIHFKFQNDVTAYRFITRAGGIPIPVATYSYKATGGTTKTYQVSPFVSLI
jgi:HK97 family phage major capsid protein